MTQLTIESVPYISGRTVHEELYSCDAFKFWLIARRYGVIFKPFPNVLLPPAPLLSNLTLIGERKSDEEAYLEPNWS